MPANIVEGIDGIIDESLNITDIGNPPHYRHGKSCVSLDGPPSSFDAYNVICQVYDQIDRNFKRPGNRFHSSGPSGKNWRFEKMLYIRKDNPSKEKSLEKAIANLTSSDWVNQVPTSSGIINSASDGSRNIDLVRRMIPGSYEFIELKVDSDTPLFAAFEITVNGLIYLASMENYADKYLSGKELLNAKNISLQTLAPKTFYSRCRLSWLEEELNRGLSKFLADKFGGKPQMNFAFTAFPENFKWPCEDGELLDALNNISVVAWPDN